MEGLELLQSTGTWLVAALLFACAVAVILLRERRGTR